MVTHSVALQDIVWADAAEGEAIAASLMQGMHLTEVIFQMQAKLDEELKDAANAHLEHDEDIKCALSFKPCRS